MFNVMVHKVNTRP